MEDLHVFREYHGTPERIGTLSYDTEASFSYDAAYLSSGHAQPVSQSLPLVSRPFSLLETAVFFEGLIPEGARLKLYQDILRGDAASYPRLLSQLSDESVGAIFFSKATNVSLSARHYRPLAATWADTFVTEPEVFPEDSSMQGRMSIAGAQGKVGLYKGPDGTWFLPMGHAPSTHIVKVSGRRFPDETLNEAACLLAARHLDLAVEEFALIPTGSHAPLLAVRRFDRTFPESPDTVDGMPVPWRLHQEDFCRVSGLTPAYKYEPTDGHYAGRVAEVAHDCSSKPEIDVLDAFAHLCFDFAVGNCDNHLKNRSMLWDADWSERRLAPIYDVISTVRYPVLSHEMGVSLCASRRIDDVTPEDVVRVGREFGATDIILAEIGGADDFLDHA